jgi:hypothetical protein
MILCCLSDSQTFLVEEEQGGRRYFVKMLPYHPMMQKMARTSLAHQVGFPIPSFEAAIGHQVQ